MKDEARQLFSRLSLLAAVAMWFASSAVCTACAKMALSALASAGERSCALTLTTLQFSVTLALSGMVGLAQGRRMPSALRELVLVSLAYVLGFLLLNQSLGRLQASFSETVRGLEPLTSFLFVRLFGGRGSQIRPSAACALLLVLGGAALSVWAQPAFDVRGLVYGLLANCAFSSRALLVTTLQDVTRASDPLQPEVDSLGLFVAQHLLGLVLLAPLALASEGTSCAAALAQSYSATTAAVASSFGFLCYNFLSLYVLLLLDAVAHSVCNTCRRAVRSLELTPRLLPAYLTTWLPTQLRRAVRISF